MNELGVHVIDCRSIEAPPRIRENYNQLGQNENCFFFPSPLSLVFAATKPD